MILRIQKTATIITGAIMLQPFCGYVLDVQRWSLAATARIDNVFSRRYAGSWRISRIVS